MDNREELQACSVEIPESLLGEVLGKLNNIGAWIDDVLECRDGLVNAKARIPMNQIVSFRTWFLENTNGLGSFTAEIRS